MSVLRRLAALLVVLASGAAVSAQDVPFESSNLPVVILDTGGEAIPDEPKITARMRIVDNGPGERNALADEPTGYDGFVGIEVRGSSSQQFPKKQYGVETRDADGDDLDVSLLGFPEEEDWVLYAPYSDKALMRNVLAYGLARRMGRYASRTRFCEVVLNGEYQGVYVFMEKVKRDDERVDVNNLKEDEVSGDDLTGGYIIKLDKLTGSRTVGGWTSPYRSPANPARTISYVFDDPDADDIAPEQAAYIERYVTDFEDAMASATYEDPATGYPAYIDLGSFVDFFLVTEVGRNIDGYRLSAYFHKDKNGLLNAGPVWDFNLAFGNGLYDGNDTAGLQVDFSEPDEIWAVPFWWSKLAESPGFQAELQARWAGLREGPLATDSLLAEIDATAALLDEAQGRNFERWPVLGEYVWPNAPGWEDRDTYAAEVEYLKGWLRERMAWLDRTFSRPVAAEPGAVRGGLALSPPAPNPARQSARLTLTLGEAQDVAVDVVDVRGRVVARLLDGPLAAGDHAVAVDAAALAAGVYLVRVRGAEGQATQRVVVAGR